MITDSNIRLILNNIENARSPEERDYRIGDLRYALQTVIDSDEYKSWIGKSELTGEKCPLPTNSICTKTLQQYGLADSRHLLVKINYHQHNFFLTDGLWVDKEVRTFPFTDESEVLLKYVNQNKYNEWAEVLIDPATGSGHHAIAAKGRFARAAFDISSRAIGFVSINQYINGTPGMLIARNNIDYGLPRIIEKQLCSNVLFVINMPFAISPVLTEFPEPGESVLPRTADAGETGSKWTKAALSMIRRFKIENQEKAAGRACVLCYSLGNDSEDRWMLRDFAFNLFGQKKVKWNLLTEEKLWRINGQKQQPNPMNVHESLPKKANCKYYVADKNREEVREGYTKLAQKLNNEGWNVLGYGILDIEL